MLKRIENLPHSVLGIRAEGTVTKKDYETVLNPFLEDMHHRGQHVRFLYQFSPEFSGFTAGAALEDFRVGLKYLRLFVRCAVVSDKDWIRQATLFVGSLMPCPIQVFRNNQLTDAIEWLASQEADSNLKFELGENGILILRPQGALRRADFDKLTSIIDPLIESHHYLRGLVISFQKFPGWENIGSLIRHIEFVSAHHKKIRRVALAADGTLPEVMSKMASHFVEAEIKQFPFEQTKAAIQWAKGAAG